MDRPLVTNNTDNHVDEYQKGVDDIHLTDRNLFQSNKFALKLEENIFISGVVSTSSKWMSPRFPGKKDGPRTELFPAESLNANHLSDFGRCVFFFLEKQK